MFSEYLIFRSEISTEQPLLEKKKFFRAVTFRKSHYFGGGIAQNKDIYRRAHFSKQVLLHRISFFRRAESSKKIISQKRNIPHFLFFLESYLFRAATFSKNTTL